MPKKRVIFCLGILNPCKIVVYEGIGGMNLFDVFNTDPSIKNIFHTDGLINSNIHPILAKSWCRSKQHNINPCIDAAPLSSQFRLCELDQILIDASLPYFKYFRDILSNCEYSIVLSNKDGVIIHFETSRSRKLKKLAEKHNFAIGADWTEEAVGTNSIGTAIIERKNILLAGSDHFSFAWDPFTCAASPIFSHINGELLGVVNITGFKGKFNSHSIGLVAAIAALIEKELDQNLQNKNRKDNQKKNYTTQPIITIKYNDTNLEIAGENSLFCSALKDAEKMAKTNISVLLTGETGTGKEVFARYIHYCSNRAKGAFVAVNCAAIPKELVGSELFGYMDGAFTGASRGGYTGRFQQADGGTLFLDEIGDAPYEVQVSLLRVLDEKTIYRLGSGQGTPVNVRVLAATSQDLTTLIKKGLFREDLYYRLAGVIVEIPALRERGEDILLLAEYFLNKFSNHLKNYILEPKLKQSMLDYKWPGNIRELRNIVERMAVLTESDALTRDLFFKSIKRQGETCIAESPDKELLIKAVKQAKGNITKVAEILDIDRTTVYRRIKKFGLQAKIV